MYSYYITAAEIITTCCTHASDHDLPFVTVLCNKNAKSFYCIFVSPDFAGRKLTWITNEPDGSVSANVMHRFQPETHVTNIYVNQKGILQTSFPALVNGFSIRIDFTMFSMTCHGRNMKSHCKYSITFKSLYTATK